MERVLDVVGVLPGQRRRHGLHGHGVSAMAGYTVLRGGDPGHLLRRSRVRGFAVRANPGDQVVDVLIGDRNRLRVHRRVRTRSGPICLERGRQVLGLLATKPRYAE